MWVYHQQWTHIPTDWLTDITLPSPNSFLPFCAVKHISRIFWIHSNSRKSVYTAFFSLSPSVGPWKLKVKTIRAFDVHTYVWSITFWGYSINIIQYIRSRTRTAHAKKEENTLPGYHFWFNDNTSMEIEYSSNSLKYLFTYLEFST